MNDNKGDAEQLTLDKVSKAYSSPPWWYDVRGFFILTFAYRSTLWAQIRFFGDNIASNHMEVAIGSGTLYSFIDKWRRWKKQPAAQVVGVDYAEAMLAGAINRFAHNPDIQLKHADVAELPYPDEYFDSVNIANAVHCFPDVDAAFKEVFRVMSPGANLAANVLLYPRGPQPLRWIAQTIDDWGIRKGILYSPYEQEDIRNRMLQQGFELVSEQIAGNTYNVMVRKPS